MPGRREGYSKAAWTQTARFVGRGAKKVRNLKTQHSEQFTRLVHFKFLKENKCTELQLKSGSCYVGKDKMCYFHKLHII